VLIAGVCLVMVLLSLGVQNREVLFEQYHVQRLLKDREELCTFVMKPERQRDALEHRIYRALVRRISRPSTNPVEEASEAAIYDRYYERGYAYAWGVFDG